MRNVKQLIFFFLLLCFLGCTRYHPLDAKLDSHDRSKGYRFKNLSSQGNSDSLFVILTFSGGGTRAAAFSFGVLEKLRNTKIKWKGVDSRLLDEVDVISSVSGGSFTAAYYALYADRIFEDFESRFLKKNIQGALKSQMFSPINWFRLASPTFDRIDMAAEYYDEHIFDHSTFSELLKHGRRPYVLFNATDVSLGSRFEFTQDQFDLICLDLSKFPISRAVAASSAFPILLSPITLKNYAGTCDFKEPEWVTNALLDRDIAKRRFNRAVKVRSYQNQKDRPYIHLLDGGVADNIGLRGPFYALSSLDSPWSVLRMINLEKVEKVVVIAVNAKTDPDTEIDQRESSPGLTEILMTVATDPMDNYSFETIDLVAESLKQWKKDYESFKSCEKKLKTLCPDKKLDNADLTKIDFYYVVIGFDLIKDKDERHFFKNLPTTFNLPPDTIDRLRAVASKLLDDSKSFQAILQDLQ